MEKITITIPDNLTDIQEIQAIVKSLGKKMLPPKNKMLGNGYTIQHLSTEILVIRKPVEKTLITYTCPICSTIFDKAVSKIFYSNYGGKTKQNRCCSNKCRDKYMSLLSLDRCALTKRKLKSCIVF